ncbi:PREDICTED: transmembrane and coiled-coil domain-containing protein 3 [Condylura cristata]|uniref:transmembrane and coiled-coil domain-containing protein 3 n=1 Tax=Condylura cristata TaxID=143302 RepID=UPI000642C2D2|nr:PREDICTED: transmembrane and coiled-coil domain-containing protein 3 [Condylura cristata]
MTASGLLWGRLLELRPAQTVFLSTCLSLSSTPLVSRFLAGSGRADKEGDLDYGAVLLGMLVTQDVQLGLLMAAVPTLAQAGAGAHPRRQAQWTAPEAPPPPPGSWTGLSRPLRAPPGLPQGPARLSLQVYLLVLSVTTLSLLLAPVLWRVAVGRCLPRQERRSSL